MAGFSDVTEAAIIALIFNATAWANYADNAASTPQTNIHMALHTADPGDSGNMSTSESAYTNYTRQNVARNSGGFTCSGNAATLTSTVSFPASGNSGTTVSHLSSGKTGGGSAAILMAGTVTPNITIASSGVTPQLGTATTFSVD